MVLTAVYLVAVALPLLLCVLAIGLRLAAVVGARIDAAVEPDAPLAEVTELPVAPPATGPVAHDLGALPQVVEPLPAPVPALGAAVQPGPLQLVDDAQPSTKVCPDCAETVLASARVCKHCHFRFEPPLQGSWAV